MKKNSRTLAIWALVIALCATTVAYAALQTTLNISGSVTKKGGTWDIHIANVSSPTIVGTASMTTTPTIRNNTDLSFAAILKKPNDSVSFTFDVVNGGSVNAYLSNSSINLDGGYASAYEILTVDDITYKLTYADGSEIWNNTVLNAGDRVTMKLTVSYDNVASISASDKVLTATATLTYSQL